MLDEDSTTKKDEIVLVINGVSYTQSELNRLRQVDRPFVRAIGGSGNKRTKQVIGWKMNKL